MKNKKQVLTLGTVIKLTQGSPGFKTEHVPKPQPRALIVF
jgi:hypothetical protein